MLKHDLMAVQCECTSLNPVTFFVMWVELYWSLGNGSVSEKYLVWVLITLIVR